MIDQELEVHLLKKSIKKSFKINNWPSNGKAHQLEKKARELFRFKRSKGEPQDLEYLVIEPLLQIKINQFLPLKARKAQRLR